MHALSLALLLAAMLAAAHAARVDGAADDGQGALPQVRMEQAAHAHTHARMHAWRDMAAKLAS